MSLLRRINSRVLLKPPFVALGLCTFLYLILVFRIPWTDNNVALTFTPLYWQQRIASSKDENKQLDQILAKSSLWRPTDEFVGNWNIRYDDRILQQILWANNARPTKKKVIALPDGFAWWWYTKKSLAAHLEKNCPNLANFCEFKEISSHASEEAFKNVDAVLTNFASSSFRKGNYVRAVYILESSFHASAHLEGTDLLCSYWSGSDIPTPYGKWVYYDPSITSKKQGRNYALGKTKTAAIFTSNCDTPNNRLGFVETLKTNGLAVDVYGACGTLTCSKHDADSCFEKLKKEYKFYLSFENSNCRDYISEKLFQNAFKNDVVPVVLGGSLDDYASIAPMNSFIHIDSFPTVAALVKHINFLAVNDAEYNAYFEWKGTGEFIDLQFFCRFCGMMHYADVVPIPVRNQSLEFGANNNEGKKLHMRPCLPPGHVHWTNPTE